LIKKLKRGIYDLTELYLQADSTPSPGIKISADEDWNKTMGILDTWKKQG